MPPFAAALAWPGARLHAALLAWRASWPRSGAAVTLRRPGPLAVLAVAAIALAAAGAWTIAVHARWLDAAALESMAPDGGLAALQPLLPGAAFDVPSGPAVRLERRGGAALLVLSGLRPEPARRIDLCSQLADPGGGRLLTLRIGERFEDVAALAARRAAAGTPLALRNVVLADEAMPRIEIGGAVAGRGMANAALPDAAGAGAVLGAPPLMLRWQGDARWIGDGGAAAPAGGSGTAALHGQGWLLWGGTRALRVLRRPSAACAQTGELVLQLYRPAPGAAQGVAQTAAPAAAQRALVAAFALGTDFAPGAAGSAGSAPGPAEIRLAPGSYRVPQAAPARLEDRQLFEQLRAHGLVRLGAGGLAELAPPDLFAWRAAGPTAWDDVVLDDEARRLLQHVYGRADGDYVREQLRIFNGERRLLAWRVQDAAPADAGAAGADAVAALAATPLAAGAMAAAGMPALPWRADAGGMPAPLAHDMPAAAARLFARLPQGWTPWQRIGAWPAGRSATLRLPLAAPAQGGERLRLMLAGRLLDVRGALLAAAPVPACSGRACRTPDQVQVLDLRLAPGARELALDAASLGLDALAMPGDARYRHLALEHGRLAWQALPAHAGAPAAAPQSPVPAAPALRLEDRSGAPLWRDGAPVDAARGAGLAALLGVHAGQQSGLAGMLGRLPGGAHRARLTIDLDLQRAAQAALDCIGLRRGRWEGGACSGAQAAPDGRQAGLVLLDAETGDILAAAGSGGADLDRLDGARWRELRDFDRADPAASPLRLPAWQHDGGAERSPGSTFKIVSALGLERAARADRSLDALLDGLPLPAINALARARGFDFRTDAPSYPAAAGKAAARITNFRDQGLDRRAQDGRLGLSQALTYSLNTWFAWTGELADRSLLGLPSGGVPDLQPLAPGALDDVRPIVAMARRLGFGQALRLDGGLLPDDYTWSAWDALQATPAAIDPVHTRHELRQMAIGLRMQATPLQMALAAAAVGQGAVVRPRLLADLDGRAAVDAPQQPLGVRLDRVRAGLKGVVDSGTAAGAFGSPGGAGMEAIRRGLSGKTGTAPVGDGRLATVWFTGWLEPHSVPGQAHRLALALFVSRSEATGGEHAAPVAAALLRHLAARGAQKTQAHQAPK
ncbi:hypothetical protein HH212_23900 [Massilia forsythiae]|uniref:beta-lactamase n=2 Tax=Massilia forsythiae TaxID=2728020 RepID=A0A7Z2W375_9BURK|nr:hypothetical protein HH212_23900 [Massilia forsythiae]